MDHLACVFDAYGTLFDVHSAVGRHAAALGASADAFSRLWRAKQLEYSWLRSLMLAHADFWEVTRDALEFAACGAHDIALGTVLFGDPGAPARVRAELVAACADAGVATPEDARALAKSPETGRKVPA